jgi:hypothetical protein
MSLFIPAAVVLIANKAAAAILLIAVDGITWPFFPIILARPEVTLDEIRYPVLPVIPSNVSSL